MLTAFFATVLIYAALLTIYVLINTKFYSPYLHPRIVDWIKNHLGLIKTLAVITYVIFIVQVFIILGCNIH